MLLLKKIPKTFCKTKKIKKRHTNPNRHSIWKEQNKDEALEPSLQCLPPIFFQWRNLQWEIHHCTEKLQEIITTEGFPCEILTPQSGTRFRTQKFKVICNKAEEQDGNSELHITVFQVALNLCFKKSPSDIYFPKVFSAVIIWRDSWPRKTVWNICTYFSAVTEKTTGVALLRQGHAFTEMMVDDSSPPFTCLVDRTRLNSP